MYINELLFYILQKKTKKRNLRKKKKKMQQQKHVKTGGFRKTKGKKQDEFVCPQATAAIIVTRTSPLPQ